MVTHAWNPSTLGGRGGQIMRSGVWDQPGQHDETLSLLKIQKLARCMAGARHPSYSGGWVRRIAWSQEAEVTVSRDRAIALQPGQQEQNSISKKKKKIILITFFTFRVIRKPTEINPTHIRNNLKKSDLLSLTIALSKHCNIKN